MLSARAGARPRIHLAQIGRRQIPVFASARPNENPGLRTPQGISPNTGMLQGFVGHLQQQTLLRIHLGGFPRRDLEELRVESVDVGQKRTPTRGPRQRGGHLGRAVIKTRPPIRRHLPHRRPTITQKLPKRFRPNNITGKTTSQTDHSDRFVSPTSIGRIRGGGLDLRFRRCEIFDERIDRWVLPEFHRRHWATHQFGKFAGQHHRVTRPDPQIRERCIQVNIVCVAAERRDQIIGQPAPQLSIGRGRGHCADSTLSNNASSTRLDDGGIPFPSATESS